jgi:hypothetical protein
VAETNGLLNRRTGKSGTEGSNPSVSAKAISIHRRVSASAMIAATIARAAGSSQLDAECKLCAVYISKR